MLTIIILTAAALALSYAGAKLVAWLESAPAERDWTIRGRRENDYQD